MFLLNVTLSSKYSLLLYKPSGSKPKRAHSNAPGMILSLLESIFCNPNNGLICGTESPSFALIIPPFLNAGCWIPIFQVGLAIWFAPEIASGCSLFVWSI